MWLHLLSGKPATSFAALRPFTSLQAPPGAPQSREARLVGRSGGRSLRGTPRGPPRRRSKTRTDFGDSKNHRRKLGLPKTSAAFARPQLPNASSSHPALLALRRPRSVAAAPHEPWRMWAAPGAAANSRHTRPPRRAEPRRGHRLRHVPASRSQAARDWLAEPPVAGGGSVARRPALQLVVAAAAAARAAPARRGSRWRRLRRRNGRRLPVS